MAVRLKNTGDVVDQYHPAGHPDSLRVEHDAVVEVPGELVEETDDAYLVGDPGVDGSVRAWPKARWEAVDEKKTPQRPAAPPAEVP